MAESTTPLVVRAATNLVVEAGDIKATYKKGTPIDFHLDEAETPFLVWSEDVPDVDMRGSSNSRVNVSPSDGRVQTVDDPNPEVRISVADAGSLQAALDALTGAGISTRQKTDDPTGIWVDRNVSANALTVLSAAKVSGASVVRESTKPGTVRHTILAFTSPEVTEAFLDNVVLDEELGPFAYERLSAVDLLVREGLTPDQLTKYMANNAKLYAGRTNGTASVQEHAAFRTITIPVRRVRRRMTNRQRAANLIRAKESYNPGKKQVYEVSYVEANKAIHLDTTGFFVVEDLLSVPHNQTAGIGRARSYLEAKFQEDIKVLSTKDNVLTIETQKDVSRENLIETMSQFNIANGNCFAMTAVADGKYAISIRKPKSSLTESYYGNEKPAFLEELEDGEQVSPDIVAGSKDDDNEGEGEGKVSHGSQVEVASTAEQGTVADVDQDNNATVSVGNGKILSVPAHQLRTQAMATTPQPH